MAQAMTISSPGSGPASRGGTRVPLAGDERRAGERSGLLLDHHLIGV
ncbi:hypothetical protein [Methanosphaerula subterraneus]